MELTSRLRLLQHARSPSRPATVLRREQTVTRNTILSVRAIRASHRIYSSLRNTRLRFNRNTPKLFHRDKYSNTFDSTRHADVSFFFYCVIETLATLLRADLIYYPCDCTKLLITELRQLRRTTYTFVHASYLSCAYSSQRTCSYFFFSFPSITFPSFRVIKERVLSPATHPHLSPFRHELRKLMYYVQYLDT